MGKTTKSSTAKTETKTETIIAASEPVTTTEKVVKVKKEKVEKIADEKASEVKTPKATKASKASASTTAVTPVESVTASTAAVSSEEESAETPLTEKSMEFMSKLQQISLLMSALKTDYRTLEKAWSKELKASQKTNNKRKKRSGNRAPSGFVKPTRISDELAKFLEKPAGSEMARTEVTRDINKYIRTHKLQDEANGRKINPDSKLAALLKLKKTDELTYFNLQRYMSPHFAKATKVDSSA